MRINYRYLVFLGDIAIFLSLLSKFIFNRGKGEELKYWLEYYANKFGIIDTGKHGHY